ncbi:MAG: ParB/RepB/Spo0J family partition protein [Rhodospirillales bacterium]|nr:ParB/RepB/Spo0J family partition protein [Rhodospirillales bacterium]
MTDILAGQPAGASAPGSMTGAVQDIHLDLIDDNPYQPRQTYEPVALEELAGSIERNGLQQIPAARRTPAGRVQLKFGHRRKRAYDLLRAKHPDGRYDHMPLQIVQATDEEMCDHAWSENHDRADLSAIEEARALQSALDQFGWSRAEFARRRGMSPATLSNKLRLLRAPDAVHQAIDAGSLSERQAAALAPLWDLPEETLTQVQRRSDNYSVASMLRAAQQGDSSDDLRKRVQGAVEATTNTLNGLPWLEIDLALGDKVQAPLCTGCSKLLKQNGKPRCPVDACYNRKAQAWADRQTADLVTATGVPAMPAKAHWSDYEQFYGEDRRLMQAAGANATPLCPNLRVSHADDGLQMAGHDGVKLTCYHPGEKGCKCVAKLKREASKDGKAVWRSLRAQTVDALTAALINPTPDAIRLVAGYHAPYDKRDQVASWRLEDCIKTIVEALIDQAKPYDVEKKPAEARTAMENLLARAYISPPWSMAARIQTDNPIARIDGRLSVIVSWILAQTTQIAMPTAAELQPMIDDTVAMLAELATLDTPERDQIAQQIDHANHSLLDMLDLVAAGYTGSKDIAWILNTPISDLNAKNTLARATYDDCRWARAVVRCQRENITKLDAIDRRLRKQLASSGNGL